MGLTRSDLVDPRISDDDKGRIKIAIDNYMANDVWAKKALLPCAVLMLSHPAQRCYLTKCVETHKKLGLWMGLAYDTYVDPAFTELDHNRFMPPKEVIEAFDSFTMGHYQVWGGVLYPFFWSLKLGINMLRDFEYIYCINGDCIITKPENFPKLFELLGDADIMSIGPVSERMINTVAFLGKTSALIQITKHFQDNFIPFENYERTTQDFGNAEGRFCRAIKDLGLKQVICEPPCNEQLHVPGKGTWYELLGFRHIHAEMNYSYRYKAPLLLPFYENLDERFLGEVDKRFLKLYEETKDEKVLEDWYAKE